MGHSFSEIFVLRLKRLLPFLSSVILLLIAYIPGHLPLSKFLRPDIGLICVYFWALYRQDLFGPFSAFILGGIADSLSSVPLGLNIFAFVFVFAATGTTGSYVNVKPFIASWGIFSLIAFAAIVLKWLLISIFYSRFLPFGTIFVGYIATVLLYPLIARLNIFIQNRFLAKEEVIYE